MKSIENNEYNKEFDDGEGFEEKDSSSENLETVDLVEAQLLKDENEILAEVQEYKKIDTSPEWSIFIDSLYNSVKSLIANTRNLLKKTAQATTMTAMLGVSFIPVKHLEFLDTKVELKEEDKTKTELITNVKKEITELMGKKYGLDTEKYSQILGEHELLNDYRYEVGGLYIGYEGEKPLNYDHRKNFTDICDLSIDPSFFKNKIIIMKLRKDLFAISEKDFSSQEEFEKKKDEIYKQKNNATINDLNNEELVEISKLTKYFDSEARLFEFIQKTNVFHEEEHYLFDQYFFKKDYEGPSKIEIIEFMKKQFLTDDLPERKILFDTLMKTYKLDKNLIIDILNNKNIDFEKYNLAIYTNDLKNPTKEDKGVLEVGFLLDEYLARVYNAGKGFDYSTMKKDSENLPDKASLDKIGLDDWLRASFVDLSSEEKKMLDSMKIKGINILDIGNKKK